LSTLESSKIRPFVSYALLIAVRSVQRRSPTLGAPPKIPIAWVGSASTPVGRLAVVTTISGQPSTRGRTRE